MTSDPAGVSEKAVKGLLSLTELGTFQYLNLGGSP